MIFLNFGPVRSIKQLSSIQGDRDQKPGKSRVDLGRVRELFTRLVAIQESPFELAIINTASQFPATVFHECLALLQRTELLGLVRTPRPWGGHPRRGARSRDVTSRRCLVNLGPRRAATTRRCGRRGANWGFRETGGRERKIRRIWGCEVSNRWWYFGRSNRVWKILTRNEVEHIVFCFLICRGWHTGEEIVTGRSGSGWSISSRQGPGIGSKSGITVGGIDLRAR